MLRALSVSGTSLPLVLCSSGSLEALGDKLFWRSYKLPVATVVPRNLDDLDYQNLLSGCPREPLSRDIPPCLQFDLKRRVSSLHPIFTAQIVSCDQHNGSVGTVSFVPIEHTDRFAFAELMARKWSTLSDNVAPLLYEFVCDGMVVQVYERADAVEGDAVITRSATQFRRVFVDLAVALRELHATGFAHGNLKPGTFYRRKDGGFSLAEVPARSTTLAFSAPELLLGTKKPSIAGDVWALGVTVLSLIQGEDVMLHLASKVDQPLDAFCSLSRVKLKYLQNYMEQKISVLSDSFKRSSVMQQTCVALRGCLQIHSEDRLNASDLVQLLSAEANNAPSLRKLLIIDSEVVGPPGLGVPMGDVGCSADSVVHSLRCILEGLTFLHAKGVMVRSISPPAVRLHGSQWKISDLRYAIQADQATHIVGDEEFRAPEMVFRVGPYDNKVDVYSAAATVITWATGPTPGDPISPTALLEVLIREGREEKLPLILRSLQCDIYRRLCLMETELALDKATLPLVNLLGLMLHFDPVKRRPPSSCLLGLHDIVTKSSHTMVS
ncbi:MAG: uncharacterized protein KVP18_005190 [Porospora cf. gigantea A]|uniref:uncharacterized protein n=1 Tax=Porospora cf. gigantea A TaxID=2853593 RepID=UPI003559F39B|nr:MAG: hypothetical protein KVP18_005190 [Porospora cf. gigantea A]